MEHPAVEVPAAVAEVKASLLAALAGLRRHHTPFPHGLVSRVFPEAVSRSLRDLPFAPAPLDGMSGKRELHNDTRHYFDRANIARFAACAAVAKAFQSDEVVGAIERSLTVDLAATFVRLEYAQDTDGFWLEPHTDLGVKRFTMLIYLSEGPGQDDLGTDIYAAPGAWAGRTAFADNSALLFVPADNTWHGLERRPIAGVRRSVIMNYVTADWRDRDQLAFPETPVLV